MEPIRGLLLVPAVLAVGIADLIGRCLRRETLDERIERMYPGMHVRTFDDIPEWQEPTT